MKWRHPPGLLNRAKRFTLNKKSFTHANYLRQSWLLGWCFWPIDTIVEHHHGMHDRRPRLRKTRLGGLMAQMFKWWRDSRTPAILYSMCTTRSFQRIGRVMPEWISVIFLTQGYSISCPSVTANLYFKRLTDAIHPQGEKDTKYGSGSLTIVFTTSSEMRPRFKGFFRIGSRIHKEAAAELHCITRVCDMQEFFLPP